MEHNNLNFAENRPISMMDPTNPVQIAAFGRDRSPHETGKIQFKPLQNRPNSIPTSPLETEGLEPGMATEILVSTSPDALIEEWQAFEQRHFGNQLQSLWCSAWYQSQINNPSRSPYILHGRDRDGDLLIVLALEQVRKGPLTYLVRPGNHHNGYYGGSFAPSLQQWISRGHGEEFWAMVFAKIGGIDALFIEGFSTDHFGINHPLSHLPKIEATHSAMRMQIETDWKAQYERSCNSKVRSNDRRCERRLQESGSLSYQVATDRETKLEFLRVMLKQKAQQFDALDISNPYQSPQVVHFYEQLLMQEDDDSHPAVFVSALHLDDEILAVNFGLIDGGILHGLITSMTVGATKRFAPGRLLLLKTNQALSDQNIKFHDFGIGEFIYKEAWCDQAIKRQHILTNLSARGLLFTSAVKLVESLRQFAENRPGLKKHLHAVRRRLNNRTAKD